MPMGSLTSTLLARKGQARPAMRSQYAGGGSATLEDLGWNDMGSDPAPTPTGPTGIATSVVADRAATPALTPVVLVEREALAAAIAAPAAERSVSVNTAARLRRETAHAGKAAFTLRVDADRHLRLRLASAITNRSAQDLVTAALDALLLSVPEVEALVAQLPTATTKR